MVKITKLNHNLKVRILTDEELELLSAMGNCYNTCLEDFEETLRMISIWRGYTTEEVKIILIRMKDKYADDSEYQRLRSRFPKEFPV